MGICRVSPTYEYGDQRYSLKLKSLVIALKLYANESESVGMFANCCILMVFASCSAWMASCLIVLLFSSESESLAESAMSPSMRLA